MKKIAAPVARGKTIKFHFPQPVRSGLRVITLKDVDHSYGDLVVYRGMQFHAERGQRTVLVGPNGAGKSTFSSCSLGYYPCRKACASSDIMCAQVISRRTESTCSTQAKPFRKRARYVESRIRANRAYCARFFFVSRRRCFQDRRRFERWLKARLALVRLLLDPPNLLLMTSRRHISCRLIDALIGALKQYHGTLIFISHDVHFIRAIATSVLHVTADAAGTGGVLTSIPPITITIWTNQKPHPPKRAW